MRLLTWNILHGGGPRRVPETVLTLLEHDADVIALSEYRASMGGQIRAVLAQHGWNHQLCTNPPARTNGLLLASRAPIERITTPPPPSPQRFLAAKTAGLNVLVVHIPEERRSTRKPAAWRHLLGEARALRNADAVVIGDYNTGRHRLDEAGSTFTCTALLGELATMGFIDAWRSLNPVAQEFTWFSHKGGGFRIDHAYLSPSLAKKLVDARYSHVEREARLSDHSVLMVELSGEAPRAPTSGGSGLWSLDL